MNFFVLSTVIQMHMTCLLCPLDLNWFQIQCP